MGFTVEQCNKFEAIYNKLVQSSSCDDVKLVQDVDTMLHLMIESGEAIVKHIHCKHVVPHPKNRNSTLMSYRTMFTKGGKILGVGFSLDRCCPKRAVCFGRTPNCAKSLDRFVKHANESPHFATFDADMIEGCSVGCGHLNQFLASIFDEAELPLEFRNNPDLVGKSIGATHLNKHNICQKDGTSLQCTMDKGLEWTYIPHKFETKYQKLPEIITKALNVEHHIGEGESWDEQ